MVSITDAKQIIRLATDAEIKVFLDGGWGVDALIGYETRRHNDIDIFVEKKDYHKFIQIIKNNGFYEIKMEYTTTNHTVWDVFVKRKCEQKGPQKVSTFSTRFHVVSNAFPKYQMLTF